MSIRIMAAVWDHAEAEGGELLVLLALADHAGDDGWCYPSVAGLAQKARLSTRQVRTCIRRLEAKGLVLCPSKTGGRGGTNRYRVTLQTRKPTSPFPGENAEADFPLSGEETRKPASALRSRKAEVCDTKGGSPLPPNRQEPSLREEEESSSSSDSPNPASPRAVAEAVTSASPSDVFGACLHAAGHAQGRRLPTHWMPPAAEVHCRRWIADLGLTLDEVLSVIEASRRQHGGDPPASPRAFDRAMQALAAAKIAPTLVPAAGAANDPQYPRTAADRRASVRRAEADGWTSAAIAIESRNRGR